METIVHGHRGCRGLMPENSIPSFLKALELGVRTLELDVVMNADGQLLVSHEPWMDANICFIQGGSQSGGSERPNIYRMKQSEIEQYDCGSRPNSRFPDQQKMKITKPLLADVVGAVRKAHPVIFSDIEWNIEIKYQEEWEDEFCPNRELYLVRFRKEIDDLGIKDKVILQCFDLELLRQARRLKVDCPLSLLTQEVKGIERNVDELGFTPEYYSPFYKFVDSKTMDFAKANGIKVAVWTVNEEKDIKKMIRLGVDAIITDFPDRFFKVMRNLKESESDPKEETKSK